MNWVYLLSFLCGVVIVNLLGSIAGVNNSLLNRYGLASLSFREIVHEEYLVHILLLRFRTVIGVWILEKLLSKKIAVIGFGILVSAALGGAAAMMILANGVWGIFFFLCALLPHGIFYGLAYVLWADMKFGYSSEGSRKINYIGMALVIAIVGIGCVCETYIGPVLLEKIIKF